MSAEPRPQTDPQGPGNLTWRKDSIATRHIGSHPPAVIPFAGRIDGNQVLVLDPSNLESQNAYRKIPDTTPFFSLKDGFSLTGFADPLIWKCAAVECVATGLLVFTTGFIAAHDPPPLNEASPLGPAGVYGTARFFGPLVGGITNWLFLTLLIYAFSSASGAHLNPTITFATFFARLVTFPRLVLYVSAQTAGASVAGLALRSAFGLRNFVVGGCVIDSALVPIGDAFTLEFTFTLVLIFLCFGVGLDPRQAGIIGSKFAPWLIGMALGLLSFGSSFTRVGYGGSSMNPARCFGVYVGSSFPTYHWIHWMGPISASMAHGVMYCILPPWLSA
ncbi:MIP transporter [Plectosphaerella cucumerina]|uniref:MIP transporter n=1 Tax=Plectosphaerella cucumerina TaxID=40658 RepID=A0A8K0X1G4_9PEZI|nr:MIP transporter [Plectosphaerella cucumerina]